MAMFTHGFNEAKVEGWLACHFNDPDSGWHMVVKEIKMLWGIQGGYEYTFPEPPVNATLIIADPKNRNQVINGEQLRALAKELFDKMRNK